MSNYPTAREYARAKDLGGQARRNGRPASDNQWNGTHTEAGRILRDAFADEWYAEDVRIKRLAGQ